MNSEIIPIGIAQRELAPLEPETIRIGLEIEVHTDQGPKIVTVGKVFPAAGVDVRQAMRPIPSKKDPKFAGADIAIDQIKATRVKQRAFLAALIATRITNLITDGIAAAIDPE